MNRIRAYYDADRAERFVPTKYRTSQNQNVVFCSLCGDQVFVDDLIFGDVNKVIEKTDENPFLCEGCLNDYEDLAHR